MANLKQEQVDRNYQAFQELLPALVASQAGKLALMRDAKIVEFFDTARDAQVAGVPSPLGHGSVGYLHFTARRECSWDCADRQAADGFSRGCCSEEPVPGAPPCSLWLRCALRQKRASDGVRCGPKYAFPIIGRDTICKGALTMSFDGHFTFSL